MNKGHWWLTMICAQQLMIVLLLLIIGLVAIDPAISYAASKTKGKLQKEVDAISLQLSPLSRKAQSRGLFSPTDHSAMIDIKLKMMDLMKENPSNDALIRPAFEAARLFKAREQYDDAFDFYNYIKANFPDSPYALQSSTEIQRMKEQLGDTYFAQPGAAKQPVGSK